MDIQIERTSINGKRKITVSGFNVSIALPPEMNPDGGGDVIEMGEFHCFYAAMGKVANIITDNAINDICTSHAEAKQYEEDQDFDAELAREARKNELSR